MLRSIVTFSLLVSMVPSAGTCFGLALPDDAVVIAPFAPVGSYAGHWGVDVAVSPGGEVAAVGSGTVSFAGSVAGRMSVTIDHGGGIRTSYSYLAGISVPVGRSVPGGATVGTAGIHDDRDAFHLSVRVGLVYVDPLGLGRCSQVPEPGLWLAMGSHEYALARDRNTRGHIRPTAHRASCHGPGRV